MVRETALFVSVALLVAAVACEAALYAFWGTAERDGYVQEATFPGDECPTQHTPKAISTGIVGECQASYKPVSLHIWDKLFLSFNTASLAGKTIDSAEVKVVVHYKAAVNWDTNLLTDFVADCISSPLAVGDTACYVAADTTIPYAALPAIGDTLTIVMRPTWVNRTGATEIVMKADREADVCAARGNNVVKLRTTEYGGTASDPRLYVWASDGKGNANPCLVLTMHNSDVDEAPEGACTRIAGDSLDLIHCYDVKLAPGNYGFVSVHVGHAPDGFIALPFGMEESGASVSFLGFFPCAGFHAGPSRAGMPAAIMVTSTTGCRQSGEPVGYLKYVCADTVQTNFNVVANTDLGHYKAINCHYQYDEGTVVLGGAQWGGPQILTCPYVWQSAEPTTLRKIKSVLR